LEYLQVLPDWQQVAPFQPWPPHWPYKDEQEPPVEAAELVVVFTVVVAMETEVVEALTVLVFVLVTKVVEAELPGSQPLAATSFKPPSHKVAIFA
jgi:hypothetical protein